MPFRLSEWKLTPVEQAERRLKQMCEMRAKMSPEARRKFEQEIAPRLLQNLSRPELHQCDFTETPVDVKTFCEDRYFLGAILRGNIYPQILEDLIELFAGNYSEVLLGGSIGWGKTTMAYTGIAYDIYKVSCMKSPQDSFGLLPGTNLAFINISVNLRQASQILFGGLGNLIRRSPYFREKFPYNPTIATELRFPRGVFAYPVAATQQAVLGEGIFSAALDEMNFYALVEKSKQNPEGGTYDQAMALYNKMSMRVTSRMNQRGILPGHLWLISSARYPNDFIERKAIEALDDPKIFVRQHALWETKPRNYFMAQTFKVEVGDVTKRTRVLTGDEQNVDPERVIEVPMDFKEKFDKDPDGAARDIAGVPVLSIRPFIGNRDMIDQMMRAGETKGIKHPFTGFSVTLQTAQERLIPENLDWVTETVGNGRAQREIRHLWQGLYFAHIDLSLSGDATGFCVTHVRGTKEITRGFGREAKKEVRPIIRIDLALQIVPPPHGEIRISAVREILYQLRDIGMQFGKVTYDSFGSEESIQILKSQGFSAENLSVDKETAPYETLKEAIYGGRIECCENRILKTELATIRKDEKTGKIDHIPNGAKDVADAVAGAVWHAEQAYATGIAYVSQASSISMGSRSGFASRQDELWAKIDRGIPLSEAEIAELQ